MESNIYLDYELIENFHDHIVYSRILLLDNKEILKELENNKRPYLKIQGPFLFAVEERLKSSVKNFNTHQLDVGNSDAVIYFLTHCAIIIDAIKLIYKNFNSFYPFQSLKKTESYPDNFYEYGVELFPDICYLPNNEKPHYSAMDDNLFSYLRALVFAHPFETSRYLFLNGATEFCSSVNIIEKESSAGNLTKYIMLHIQSDNSDDIDFVYVPIIVLKKYIHSRYILLMQFRKIIEESCKQYRDYSLKLKCVWSPEPIKTLKSIATILEVRSIVDFTPESAAKMLNFHSTLEGNNAIVEQYKQELEAILCDCCELIDEGKEEECLDKLKIYTRPSFPAEYRKNKKSLLRAIYQHENAKEILDSLKKQWIIVDLQEMNEKEVERLITIACYFENKIKVCN